MPPVVLHIDDCSDDLKLIEFACSCAEVSFQLRSVDNGQKAIQYLSGLGMYTDRARFPLPSLILLDLKMPAMSGFDVLAWIRNIEHFNNVAVVVFTGSVHSEDSMKALELGANQFWVKPANFQKLQEMMSQIDRQLLGTAETTFAATEPKLSRRNNPPH